MNLARSLTLAWIESMSQRVPAAVKVIPVAMRPLMELNQNLSKNTSIQIFHLNANLNKIDSLIGWQRFKSEPIETSNPAGCHMLFFVLGAANAIDVNHID